MPWLLQAASLGAERDAYSPVTYTGYGSCLGTTNSGFLNWGVYYFRQSRRRRQVVIPSHSPFATAKESRYLGKLMWHQILYGLIKSTAKEHGLISGRSKQVG